MKRYVSLLIDLDSSTVVILKAEGKEKKLVLTRKNEDS